MENEKSLIPPNENIEHKSQSLIKGLAGGIPFAGGLAGESLDLIWKTGYEKRLKEWRKNISNTLSSLLEQSTISELINNEEFKSLLAESSIIALRNHQEEKLNAIKNLLAKSVTSPLEYDFKKLFLNYIDQFTVYHIKALENINFNLNQTESNFLPINKHKSRMLEEIFVGEDEFFNQIIEDLQVIKGLIIVKKGPIKNYNTTTYFALTKLGYKFVKFIED